jgi:hypothetical protein
MKWRRITPDTSVSVRANLHPSGCRWNGVLNSLRQGSYVPISALRRIMEFYTTHGELWKRYQQYHFQAWESRWQHWVTITEDDKRNEGRSNRIRHPDSD